MNLTKTFGALLVTSAMTVATAQTGTDGCTTPDPIAGQGSFLFDQTLATTGIEGQTEALCYFFASTTVDSDVWFAWTADATGTAQISTCTTIVDTKLAAYPGSTCPTAGTALACNDDSCGLQSSMGFPVTNGTTYTLQVGTFPGATGGTGMMDIIILPPVTNDDCSAPNAIAGQGSFFFNNLGATTGIEGQTEAVCYEWGSTTVDNDVWYTWTADATGVAVVSTCTSPTDTKIGAYPGGGCPTAGTALACNDDACGTIGFQSQITFAVTNGTSYMLQVGTFPGATGGTGNMDIVIVPPAVNDDCASPSAIAGQGSFPFSQIGATTGLEGQTEFLCYAFGSSVVDNDVWFSWTADATGIATLSTCNQTVDTKVAAYPGGGCPTAGSALACNDDSCGLQSSMSFAVTNGTSYMLQVGTFPGAVGGTGTMDIVINPPAPNDSCASPTAIAGQGSFPFSQVGAITGIEGQSEGLCYFFGSTTVDNDVWFSWTADATGLAIIGTCTSIVDTKIAVYPGTGCPTAGSALACNDDACGLQTQVLANVTNGTTYTLQVGTFPGATGGTGLMDIQIVPPLTNDQCASPDVIAGQGNFPFDPTYATTGVEGQSESLCYAFGSSGVFKDVWFSWTANATGPATVSLCATTAYDSKIAAYPGTGCPVPGSALACNDDTCGLQSEITFNVVSGTTYTLQMGTFSDFTVTGPTSMDISIAGPAEPGSAFCFCDTIGSAPCGNEGNAGAGCQNSTGTGGAVLGGSGIALVGSDTVLLSASGLVPNQPGLYFQGNNAINGGLGVIFGDGIRCAGQNVIRLGVRVANASGESSTTGITVSVKGGVTAGDLKHYQVWYRDPNGGAGGPCGNVFNLSNGYSIQW
ncbi:MAG: hypothetical protein H6828_13045 [Planctomycetes bacterium]|nr:hypothetical protein [Planctomycetota bacterium]